MSNKLPPREIQLSERLEAKFKNQNYLMNTTNKELNIAISRKCGSEWAGQDYCNDFNALHEVLRPLSKGVRLWISGYLAGKHGHNWGVTATARDRAEAIVLSSTFAREEMMHE